VETLLKGGSDVTIEDNEGMTPWDCARDHHNVKVMIQLIHHHDETDSTDISPEHPSSKRIR